MTQTGERILATVKGNVSLSAFDAISGERLASVPVGTAGVSKPHEIAITSDGSHAFVSLYGDKDYGPNAPDNRLAVVDLTRMKLVGHVDLGLYSGPHALMTDPDGMIWVTVDANRCVLVLDPATREIEHTIHLGVPGHFLAATSDGGTVYFSAKEYPFICEVDVVSREMRARIPLPVGAQAIRVSHDDQRLYVGHLNRPLLHVVDRVTRQGVETVPLTAVPGWPFVTPDGALVLVTTHDAPADRGFVELLDAGDLTRRTAVEVPGEPFHALPMHDGEHVLVALASGEIVKIHLGRAELVPGGFHAGNEMPEMLLHLRD
ncbi:MAG: YncE family protein [Boseongicola sp. SB0675_bin_26]|nr:YncE family protein [Boseongicola sp. SB0675_bin_26]